MFVLIKIKRLMGRMVKRVKKDKMVKWKIYKMEQELYQGKS